MFAGTLMSTTPYSMTLTEPGPLQVTGSILFLECKHKCILYSFLMGQGVGKLFLARESLVSDILAGDGNIAKPFLQ